MLEGLSQAPGNARDEPRCFPDQKAILRERAYDNASERFHSGIEASAVPLRQRSSQNSAAQPAGSRAACH